jgi:hypothetical protein
MATAWWSWAGRYLHDTGKSLFVWDCVVGLGRLELLTKRLSAGTRLCDFARPAVKWGLRMYEY